LNSFRAHGRLDAVELFRRGEPSDAAHLQRLGQAPVIAGVEIKKVEAELRTDKVRRTVLRDELVVKRAYLVVSEVDHAKVSGATPLAVDTDSIRHVLGGVCDEQIKRSLDSTPILVDDDFCANVSEVDSVRLWEELLGLKEWVRANVGLICIRPQSSHIVERDVGTVKVKEDAGAAVEVPLRRTRRREGRRGWRGWR